MPSTPPAPRRSPTRPTGRTQLTRRARLILTLDVLVAAAAIVTLATWATGGIRTSPFGIRVSSSSVLRPFLIAVVAWLAARWLGGDIARSRPLLARAAVPAAALAVVAFSWWQAAPYAAAADMFGYVSQAFDWRAGSLVHAEWAVAPPGFPPGATVPLGYLLRMDPAPAAVALYPPGLPLHMAAASLVAPWAVYLVSPLAAAALVFGTHALGRVWRDEEAGRWAAVLVAFSPVLLAQAVVPMSDTLAAAYWTWAFVFAASARHGGHVVAGVLAGLAIAVRPSLAPLAVPLLAASAITAGVRGTLLTLMAGAPLVAALALHDARLYGNALATGYGDTGQLFALANLGANVRNYGAWLVMTSSPLVLAGAAAGAVWTVLRTPQRIPVVGLVAITVAIHLLYLPWPNWTFTRFLLPALPAMFVMTMVVGLRLTRDRPWAFPLLALGVLAWQMQFTHRSEIRYTRPAMSRFEALARHLKANGLVRAPIVTRLHSGSLRFYAGAEQAVRWDQVSTDELRRGVQLALDAGMQPLFVDDVDDRADFEARFGPLACWADESRVLFDVRAPAPVRVLPARPGC